MWPDQSLHRHKIVVATEQILKWRIERAAMTAEIKDSAMIAALKDQDLRSAGDGSRCADRHQIGFGPGIGETHQIDRRETGTNRRGEPRLGRVVSAKIEAAVESLFDRPADCRMRMTKDSGSELAQEVDILVPVEIPQPGPLAA